MISFPSNTRDTINLIREAIGRGVVFYSGIYSDCPTCEIDPITGHSYDSFCPTCSGLGYFVTYSGTEVLAHITYNPGETMQFTVGGNYPAGDCRLQIEHTPTNVTILDQTEYVMIDGKKFDVRKKFLRGVKEINRILIDCIERP